MSPADRWRLRHMVEAMIHAYFDINRGILWDTVVLALPPLLEQLKTIPPTD